ncbi:MAG: hypothetical protein WCG93_12845 [Paludibacter sp.]
MYKLYIGNKIPNNIGTFLFVDANTHPYKGVWNNSTAYSAGEAVFYSYNSKYYYASANIGVDYDPSNPLWTYAGSNAYVDDKFTYTTEWSLADLGNDKPAMNYQANNIAELKDRQANYSQALKLPMTKNNCLIFGHSETFDVLTSIPYKKFECRLFSNESVLAGTGSVLIIDKCTTDFEVAILSGNVDFFELLSNKSMADLDLGTYILGSQTVLNNYSNVNYCIPVATFLAGGTGQINTAAYHCYPFAYLKNAIEKIITSNGYTLITNLLDADWNKKAINVCSLNPNSDSLNSFEAYAGGNSSAGAGVGEYIVFNINPTGNGLLTAFNESGVKGMRWTSPIDCSIKIAFGVTTPTPLAASDLVIKNNTNVILNLTALNGSINQVINVSKGDILEITAWKRPNSSNPARSSYTFRLSEMITETVPTLGKLYISPNLGFDTQFDFFKMFVQVFGLTLSVDNVNKVVRAYTMQKLYDNKVIAKDWSKKLNDVPSDMYFTFGGYAQKNLIKFDDNSADNVTDSGSFAISNETIEKSKDLFSIKLESGLDRILNSHSIANIPLEEIDSSNVISFKGGKPHIVNTSSSPITINGTAYNLNIANHSNSQSFIDSFYTGLVTMLGAAKYTEDFFYLTDKDIEDFNQFVPVYVQKYGHYFYVNKIVNYVSGELTKCQLIKL